MLEAGLGGNCRQLPVGHESLPDRKLVEKAQIEWLTDVDETQAACSSVTAQKEDGSGSAHKMARIKKKKAAWQYQTNCKVSPVTICAPTVTGPIGLFTAGLPTPRVGLSSFRGRAVRPDVPRLV
jgi:hypothetical protein